MDKKMKLILKLWDTKLRAEDNFKILFAFFDVGDSWKKEKRIQIVWNGKKFAKKNINYVETMQSACIKYAHIIHRSSLA